MDWPSSSVSGYRPSVTARRLAETSREAHLTAEAMYRDLFDSNQAPILIIDGDGIVVETNASAQRAFGRHELPSSHSSSSQAGWTRSTGRNDRSRCRGSGPDPAPLVA